MDELNQENKRHIAEIQHDIAQLRKRIDAYITKLETKETLLY